MAIIYSVLGTAGPAWNSPDSPAWLREPAKRHKAMAGNVDPNKNLRFADSPAAAFIYTLWYVNIFL